jgi:hypothetical protein
MIEGESGLLISMPLGSTPTGIQEQDESSPDKHSP